MLIARAADVDLGNSNSGHRVFTRPFFSFRRMIGSVKFKVKYYWKWCHNFFQVETTGVMYLG